MEKTGAKKQLQHETSIQGEIIQSVLEAGRTSTESLMIMGWVGVMAREISHKEAMLELDIKAV